MTDTIPADAAHDIARIIRGAPEGEMTSGQILLMLNQAWDAGQRAGFAQGHLAGQTHAIAVQDLVRQSMQR